MRVRLPKDAGAPLLARAFVRNEVCERHSKDARDRVELLASELVTNAIVHAGSLVTMDLDCEAEGGILVEVADGSSTRPVLREAGLMEESGRGLELVDKLSSEWGVREGGLREAVPAAAGAASGDRGSAPAAPALPGPLAAALGGMLPRQSTGKVVWFRVEGSSRPGPPEAPRRA